MARTRAGRAPGSTTTRSSRASRPVRECAGHDRAAALGGEHAVDPESRSAAIDRRRRLGDEPVERRAAGRRARPHRAVDGDDRRLLEERPGHAFGDLERHQLEPVGVDQVRLGERDHAVADPEHLEDPQVLLGLRLPALAGGDDEQAGVDGTDAGQHVRQEPHVARHVDEADRGADRQHRVGEAEVDREPAPLAPPRTGQGRCRSAPAPATTCRDRRDLRWRRPSSASADSAATSTSSSSGSTLRRSSSVRPSRARPTIGGSWARSASRWSPAMATPADAIVTPGRGPGAGQRLGVGDLADGAARHDLRRPPPELGERLIDHPPEGDLGRDRAMEVRQRASAAAPPARGRRNAGRGRVDGRRTVRRARHCRR